MLCIATDILSADSPLSGRALLLERPTLLPVVGNREPILLGYLHGVYDPVLVDILDDVVLLRLREVDQTPRDRAILYRTPRTVLMRVVVSYVGQIQQVLVLGAVHGLDVRILMAVLLVCLHYVHELGLHLLVCYN